MIPIQISTIGIIGFHGIPIISMHVSLLVLHFGSISLENLFVKLKNGKPIRMFTILIICTKVLCLIVNQFFRLPKELFCTIIASLLGAPSGVILFLPNYHPLHDIFKVHSEVTFFIIFTIFLLIIWTADRQPRHTKSTSTEHKTHWSTWLLILHLFIHYGSFLGIVSFMKPENEIAIGLKEPVGPCNEYVPMQTAFGMVNIFILSCY